MTGSGTTLSSTTATCTEVVCTVPTNTTGYATVTNTQLNVATGFAVTAACATGYEGTAAAAACTTGGIPACTDDPDGMLSMLTNGQTCLSEFNSPRSAFHNDCDYDMSEFGFVGLVGLFRDTCPVTCGDCAPDSDYTDYTLSGCTEVVCTEPADTTGYATVTNTQLNVVTGFAVTAECAAGYEGTAAAAACTTSGEYTLSGCTEVPDKTSGAAVNVVTLVALASAALTVMA